MPRGMEALAFEGELPDYLPAAGPEHVNGPGWLFSDTGDAHDGMV